MTTDPDAREASDPAESVSRPGRARRWAKDALERNLENVARPEARSTGHRDLDDATAPWRRFSLWFPLAVFAVTRVVTALVVVVTQGSQLGLPASNGILRIMFPTEASPGYWVVMSNWDGQWYQQIATHGYPLILPRTDAGVIDMNPWAFYPLYPMTVGGIVRVTGLSFAVAGGLLSMLLGAAGMVVLFRLVDRVVGRWEAVVAVVGLCTFISAPILQATYTESLAILLVAVLLTLLRARRYWWVAGVLVLLALSRNVVAAMAPVILAHLVVRWHQEPDLSRRTKGGLLALAAFSGALTALWPGIIGVVTGVPNAYTQTLVAWRVSSDLQLDSWWNYLLLAYGWIGAIAGIAAAGVFGWFMLTHRTWRWGPEIWGWAGAYPAYQLLVTNPGSSRLRYAILAFPFTLLIAWFLGLRPWRRWRVLLLGGVALLGLAQQAWYVDNFILVTHLTGQIGFP
ncbi:MAG: hypothetical protein ABI083_09980 [Lapillicoccus sp.]